MTARNDENWRLKRSRKAAPSPSRMHDNQRGTTQTGENRRAYYRTENKSSKIH